MWESKANRTARHKLLHENQQIAQRRFCVLNIEPQFGVAPQTMI